MKLKYKKLGNFIKEINLKNKDLKETNLLGVSISKKFIPSIANTHGTNFKNYKVIKYNQFAYGPVTSRNGDKISIALFKEKSGIISSSYKVFSIIDEDIINPDYLMLWFERKEFDRYARYKSHGSVREIFSWEELCKTKIPVLDIEFQNKIVEISNFLKYRIELKEKINNNLEKQAIISYKKLFFNYFKFKDSEVLPIPKNWSIKNLGDKNLCKIIRSGIKKFGDNKIYLATADVDELNIINNNNLITYNNRPNRANMQPTDKSIWFAKMKNSRKIIIIDEFNKDLQNNYILSTGFCGLQCTKDSFYILSTFLLTDEFESIKNNYCHGTTMQAINNEDVKQIRFIFPDKKTIHRFNDLIKPLFEKIYLNNSEINNLINLKTIILSELILGESCL